MGRWSWSHRWHAVRYGSGITHRTLSFQLSFSFLFFKFSPGAYHWLQLYMSFISFCFLSWITLPDPCKELLGFDLSVHLQLSLDSVGICREGSAVKQDDSNCSVEPLGCCLICLHPRLHSQLHTSKSFGLVLGQSLFWNFPLAASNSSRDKREMYYVVKKSK